MSSIDRAFDAAVQEWRGLKGNRLSIAILTGFAFTVGIGGGWYLATQFYAERIKVLETSLAQAPQKTGTLLGAANDTRPGIRGPVTIGWGRIGPTCGLTIRGTALMDYSERYVVGFACGLASSAVDRYEDTNISVSRGFNITSQNIEMSMPHSPAMRAAIETNATAAIKQTPGFKEGQLVAVPAQVWNEVFLLPKGVDGSGIAKLSDVLRLGGKVPSMAADPLHP
jgi:hypothetical protein